VCFLCLLRVLAMYPVVYFLEYPLTRLLPPPLICYNEHLLDGLVPTPSTSRRSHLSYHSTLYRLWSVRLERHHFNSPQNRHFSMFWESLMRDKTLRLVRGGFVPVLTSELMWPNVNAHARTHVKRKGWYSIKVIKVPVFWRYSVRISIALLGFLRVFHVSPRFFHVNRRKYSHGRTKYGTIIFIRAMSNWSYPAIISRNYAWPMQVEKATLNKPRNKHTHDSCRCRSCVHTVYVLSAVYMKL
jgi:hypothetical protein